MLAHFHGGPADGHTLSVRTTEVFVAMIGGVPVEYPSWPDQRVLQAADDTGWTRYVAVGEISEEAARYEPA